MADPLKTMVTARQAKNGPALFLANPTVFMNEELILSIPAQKMLQVDAICKYPYLAIETLSM
jgi:hypothetical protein